MPRSQRELNASQIIDRLRPQLAKITGANLFLQAAQDITVGGRAARAAFQYTLQDPNIAELNEWSLKLLDKMRTLPELVDVSSDLLASAPQLSGEKSSRSGRRVAGWSRRASIIHPGRPRSSSAGAGYMMTRC